MADNRKFRQYTDLFYEVQPKSDKVGDWCVTPYAYLDGELPGAMYNIGFQVIKKPVEMKLEPHFHREEQYHVFLGSKPPDVFDFDAEIEFYMGEDPDNLEKIVITKPTIIRVPRGVWHCPLIFKKVNKPVWFQAGLLYGTYAAFSEKTDSEGKKVLVCEN
jgi:hypothetical protein